jgi:quercetin dioxygenase-like cupin family protein
MTASVADVSPITRFAEHGGSGPILFRRLIESTAFHAPVDFVDYTTIPPGSIIGRHQHVGNEEMYFVLAGQPLVTVENDAQRLAVGSLSIVRDGQSHELINDTAENVTILVVQVRT